MKFVRIRAIIVVDDKLAVMCRDVEGRKYYTFPGGFIDSFESDSSCVIRTVKEELGIDVMPMKRLYEFENNGKVEYFYLCVWLTGTFETKANGEFKQNNIAFDGKTIPEFVDTIEDVKARKEKEETKTKLKSIIKN